MDKMIITLKQDNITNINYQHPHDSQLKLEHMKGNFVLSVQHSSSSIMSFFKRMECNCCTFGVLLPAGRSEKTISPGRIFANKLPILDDLTKRNY